MELIKQLHTNDLERYLKIANENYGLIQIFVTTSTKAGFVELTATEIQKEIELRKENKMEREILKTETTENLYSLLNYLRVTEHNKVTYVVGKGWRPSDSIGETIEDIHDELIRRGKVTQPEPQQEAETPEGLREQAAQLLTRARELEESLEGKAKEYYTTLMGDETAWDKLTQAHKENVIRHVQAMS